MYYTGLAHQIPDNKTILTERYDKRREAEDSLYSLIRSREWKLSDCELSVLTSGQSGRPWFTTKIVSIVAVSGGFDPIHIGHIRMIQEATKIGHVIVILNSDDFLRRKKGYVFMSFEERKEIMESIKGVEQVYKCIDKDDTVIETLRWLKPDYFVNGGDVVEENNKEKDVCEDIGCKLIYGVGGEKIQSSSVLISKVKGRKQ